MVILWRQCAVAARGLASASKLAIGLECLPHGATITATLAGLPASSPSRVASLALLHLLPLDLDSEHHPVSYPCRVCSSCRLVVGRGFSLSSPPRSSCMSAVITLASGHRCLHNADLPACAPGAARASCFPWPGGLTSSPATPLHAALTSRRRPCTTFAPPVPVVCRCQPRQPSHRLTFTPAILTTTPARSGEGASDPVAERGRGEGEFGGVGVGSASCAPSPPCRRRRPSFGIGHTTARLPDDGPASCSHGNWCDR